MDLPDDEPPADNPTRIEEIFSEFEGIQSGNESAPEDGTLSKEDDLETLTEAQLNALQTKLEKQAQRAHQQRRIQQLRAKITNDSADKAESRGTKQARADTTPSVKKPPKMKKHDPYYGSNITKYN
jgi:hypothetical protein